MVFVVVVVIVNTPEDVLNDPLSLFNPNNENFVPTYNPRLVTFEENVNVDTPPAERATVVSTDVPYAAYRPNEKIGVPGADGFKGLGKLE
jgi:hypothetical protein